ncbi:alpha/beta hydrolase domain-containing protein [Sphingomonas psychrolutea]|uniref:Alpha/beta hydrolase domain-containing protein n=1 Tax=Sphingomonas psychrolutea TaxID=1259676 RepID=A0ABQ1G510_9SPHN|nr:alpha/beta hydrolase domain-containing protein [Sphingomonas psychrolutea]GGA36852.1 hypothetical protein GCM10011395_03950 [Sphingomonas psychrolutea]
MCDENPSDRRRRCFGHRTADAAARVDDGAVPQAPGIVIDANHEVRRDSNGNPLGGVWLPYIDAPIATYTGYLSAGGMGGVTGAKKPFAPERLKALYANHAAYLATFSAATDRLLSGRWISAQYAAAMKVAAAK